LTGSLGLINPAENLGRHIYSPVMSGITPRYLISLAVQNRLSMQLMDVVTTYLYGSLDSKIYMNVPDGISISNPKANSNMFCVKLQKS
jgi:hypothetical protein